MKDVFFRVTKVSEPKVAKGGQSFVTAEVQHVEERVGAPKRKSLGNSRITTSTLVLWLPGTEFDIPGSNRKLVPTNMYPLTGLEVGDEIDGSIAVVECHPAHPYTWKSEDGSTIVQREVKVAVMADPSHSLYRQFLIEAIAAKGIIPADESLARQTLRIPAAMKAEQGETPAQEPPAQASSAQPVQDAEVEPEVEAEIEVEGNTSDPF